MGTKGVPTFIDHPDKGCDVAPLCVECPLPFCKYDNPKAYHSWQKDERDSVITADMPNLSQKQLAAKYGLSVRTIQRIK